MQFFTQPANSLPLQTFFFIISLTSVPNPPPGRTGIFSPSVVIHHWFASCPPPHTVVTFTTLFTFQIAALFFTFFNGRLLHFNNCQSARRPQSGQTGFYQADKTWKPSIWNCWCRGRIVHINIISLMFLYCFLTGFVLSIFWVPDLGLVTRTFLLRRVCLFVSPLSVKTLFQALSLWSVGGRFR